jgi:hypothetical protein
MLFPKDKMHVVTSYEGRTSDDGWLVLDFTKLDVEGIGKVYVDLAQVHKLEQEKSGQKDLLEKTKNLLSLDEE